MSALGGTPILAPRQRYLGDAIHSENITMWFRIRLKYVCVDRLFALLVVRFSYSVFPLACPVYSKLELKFST